MSKRSSLRVTLIAALLVLGVCGSVVAVLAPGPAGAAGRLRAGVLIADPAHLAQDHAAGVRVATLELSWRRAEPNPAAGARTYLQPQARAAAAYRAAGYTVAVDVGLQDPPAWLLALPGGQLRDQSGSPSGTPNFFYNNRVRSFAQAYIDQVVRALGPVSSYRLGLSPHGETLYPDAQHGQWWAFDAQAQGAAPGLPPATPAAPLPGWVPGTTRYRGQPVTVQQAQRWYDWYFDASVSAHAWEAGAFRSAGFTGLLQLVMPGSGANPWVLSHRVAGLLRDEPYDGYRTLNTAAVWFQFLHRFPARAGIAVDISSVYDRSGVPRGNACQAGDAQLSLAQAGAAPWSSTRWLTYLAHRNGYAAVLGENTGNSSAQDMRRSFALASACGLEVLSWAWDFQLYEGRYASIHDLSVVLAGLG